jgi:hypothetical protein
MLPNLESQDSHIRAEAESIVNSLSTIEGGAQLTHDILGSYSLLYFFLFHPQNWSGTSSIAPRL